MIGKVRILAVMFIVFGGAQLGYGSNLNYSYGLRLIDTEISQTTAYQKYKQAEISHLSEAKYLIFLIKESNYTYWRNGQEYSCKTAAKFLNYIMKKNEEDIANTEEFIDLYASYSGKTGKPYYIEDHEGHKYSARQVLYNELKSLRQFEDRIIKQAKL